MFKGSSLSKYAIGFVIGAIGAPALTSKIAKKAYTYVTAGAFIARDSIMENVEILHAQALDIADDAKVLTEKYYADRDKCVDTEVDAE